MSEGGPPESAGRPHEADGNAGPRWMTASPGAARLPGDRTRRTGRLVRRWACDLRRRPGFGPSVRGGLSPVDLRFPGGSRAIVHWVCTVGCRAGCWDGVRGCVPAALDCARSRPVSGRTRPATSRSHPSSGTPAPAVTRAVGGAWGLPGVGLGCGFESWVGAVEHGKPNRRWSARVRWLLRRLSRSECEARRVAEPLWRFGYPAERQRTWHVHGVGCCTCRRVAWATHAVQALQRCRAVLG
jgi:hypothetical protein